MLLMYYHNANPNVVLFFLLKSFVPKKRKIRVLAWDVLMRNI